MAAILTSDAIEYYWDRCYDFVMDNIIWPARRVWPDLTPTPHQKELMDEISREDRVAVESGHGSGKSSDLSWIGCWWIGTRGNNLGRNVKVPVIAPTYHQLYDIIWPEFKRWIPLSRLKPILRFNSVEVWRVGMKDQCWIRARSPKIPENIQGEHAAHILWLIDEAFNIVDELFWENVEGSMTTLQQTGGENKIIIAGQHTTIRGYCHDAFNRDKDDWKQLRFNSEKSPIADKAFNERIARKYGKDSDIYRVRVLGQAPRGMAEAFISLERAELARSREVAWDETAPLEAGIDCARFGDDLSVSTLRKGFKVFPQKMLPMSDSFDIAEMFLKQLREYRSIYKDHSLCKVKVDATGGWGAGAIDILNRNTTDDIEVIPVYVTGEITDDEYFDATSKMWGELRDVIDSVDLPDDDFLIEEIATRGYEIQENKNKTKIWSKKKYKDEYKKMGGEVTSPDRSDSLCLAFSQKAGILRVFPYYRATDPRHRTNLKIAFADLMPEDYQVYGTLFLDEDEGLYGSMFFWGRVTRKLFVYGEYVEPSPVARLVVLKMREIAGLSFDVKQRNHVTKFYGNEAMFRQGRDIRTLIRKEKVGKEKKEFLRLYEPPKYEESGAIMLANKMFLSNQIVVGKDLKQTDYQYRFWRKEKYRPIDRFPLCRALLMVVSELRAKGELVVAREKEVKKYSKEYRKKQEEVRGQATGYNRPRVERGEYDYLLR